ncbi:ubiquinol-cytochrome-c reductase complex assembly factor 3-like [Eleutherodactylus coqui]|uniref:ubiquinol-cytochrome-c reductase complex assembly factor 3-like n=1 Tax=Eleutherodactylus coqui TaxID=57060 RepID=UPI0034637F3A
MSTAYRLVVGSLWLAGCTGLGCLLWSFMAPKQEQLLEMRMKEMKVNPAMMAELRAQNEIVLQALKEAAETNVNITNKPQWRSR